MLFTGLNQKNGGLAEYCGFIFYPRERVLVSAFSLAINDSLRNVYLIYTQNVLNFCSGGGVVYRLEVMSISIVSDPSATLQRTKQDLAKQVQLFKDEVGRCCPFYPEGVGAEVKTLSELRKVLKTVRGYADTYQFSPDFFDGMNEDLDRIEQDPDGVAQSRRRAAAFNLDVGAWEKWFRSVFTLSASLDYWLYYQKGKAPELSLQPGEWGRTIEKMLLAQWQDTSCDFSVALDAAFVEESVKIFQPYWKSFEWPQRFHLNSHQILGSRFPEGRRLLMGRLSQCCPRGSSSLRPLLEQDQDQDPLDLNLSHVVYRGSKTLGCRYVLNASLFTGENNILLSGVSTQVFSSQRGQYVESLSHVIVETFNKGKSTNRPGCFPAQLYSIEGNIYMFPLPKNSVFPTERDGICATRVDRGRAGCLWSPFPRKKGTPYPPIRSTEGRYVVCQIAIHSEMTPTEVMRTVISTRCCVLMVKRVLAVFPRIDDLLNRLHLSEEQNVIPLLRQVGSSLIKKLDKLCLYISNTSLKHPFIDAGSKIVGHYQLLQHVIKILHEADRVVDLSEQLRNIWKETGSCVTDEDQNEGHGRPDAARWFISSVDEKRQHADDSFFIGFISSASLKTKEASQSDSDIVCKLCVSLDAQMEPVLFGVLFLSHLLESEKKAGDYSQLFKGGLPSGDVVISTFISHSTAVEELEQHLPSIVEMLRSEYGVELIIVKEEEDVTEEEASLIAELTEEAKGETPALPSQTATTGESGQVEGNLGMTSRISSTTSEPAPLEREERQIPRSEESGAMWLSPLQDDRRKGQILRGSRGKDNFPKEIGKRGKNRPRAEKTEDEGGVARLSGLLSRAYDAPGKKQGRKVVQGLMDLGGTTRCKGGHLNLGIDGGGGATVTPHTFGRKKSRVAVGAVLALFEKVIKIRLERNNAPSPDSR